MSDYLIHFNPYHSKADGRFTSGGARSQAYPSRKGAKQYQKQLDRITKQDIKLKEKAMNIASKAQKLEKKSPMFMSDKKYDEKRSKYEQQYNKFRDRALEGEKIAKRILKQAKAEGYDTNTEIGLAMINKGKTVAQAYLTGAYNAEYVGTNVYSVSRPRRD